jgi:3-oxoacyl-[acyl-carrier protein] reductase
MRFKGMTAIIAGGAGGIGKAVTQSLAAEGAKVIIWDIDETVSKAVRDEIRELGGEASTMKVNALDFYETEECVKRVVDKEGSLEIMVNAIGGGGNTPFIDYTPDIWQKGLDYNLNSVFNCFHAAISPMVERQFGRLLYFASATGGVPNNTVYCAAKAACKGLMENIAVEHARNHITANAIMPGVVLTPYSEKSFSGPEGEKKKQYALSFMPLGFNTPENVARTALYVLAEERLNGQVINLN